MGGSKFQEVGGGPATGLSEDFVRLLRGSLFGNFGGQPTAGQRFNAANPVGSTTGIARILQNILGEGAGTLGGSLAEMIRRESTRNIADLRARFGAGGGAAFGTPAAYAESLYRAEAAPRTATAVGQLQLSTLLPLLQLSGALSERGIAPRQIVARPSAFSSILSTLAPAVSAAVPFLNAPSAALTGTEFSDIINQGGGAPDLSSVAPFKLY